MGLFNASKVPQKLRLHVNLARIKKMGRKFEIAVDPDQAILFKEGKIEDIREVLVAERIFEDVQKGVFSSQTDIQTVFPGLDDLQIAQEILKKGELQLSQAYRERLQLDKRRKILEIIHRNAVNPVNNLPHPMTRLENAFAEAKIRIDDKKTADDQVQDILKKLKVVLPIKIENKKVQIHISDKYAKKYFKVIHAYGKVYHEEWLDDGCYLCHIEVPAGLYIDLVDDLSKKTHGGVEIKVLSTNERFYEN